MIDHDSRAEVFEEHRAHLRSVAYRMLGSASVADDAVQETWLRFSRSDTSAVGNLRGWLTTVAARVCLDMLRARRSRREDPLDEELFDTPAGADPAEDFRQERDLILADAVGQALITVLDTLAPAERVAFVLHDLFDMSFEEIAPVVARPPLAARKLASRARQRLRTTNPAPQEDPTRRRTVVEAFLSASRGGDFAALLSLLDPEVVLRADSIAVRMGASAEVRGAHAVAETFKGRAQVAQTALLDGTVGAAWSAGGQVRVAFAFTITDGRITAIDLLADPERLQTLNITLLD